MLEAARLFLSSHIWEIPWAGGSWEDERFLFAALLYWKRFFFLQPFITITGKQPGSWSESIFFGGVDCGAAVCKSNRGKRLCSFVFLFLFSKLVTIPPLWEAQRVDLSCLVLLSAALTNTRALCVTGYFPLRLRKKDNCLIIILCFCFYFLFLFCEAYGSGFGWKGKPYMNNEIWFCGSGFSKGFFSRAFSIHIWSRPFFGVVANLHGKFW